MKSTSTKNRNQNTSLILEVKMNGYVLKRHSYLGSHIPSTHKSTPPPRGVLRVMLTGGMAIWRV